MIFTVLHYYRFNVSDPIQKRQYVLLCHELQNLNLVKFDSIASNQYQWYNDKIKPLDCNLIELDTKYLFNNQWNTTEKSGNLRLFDWAEAIYPNKNVKEGYWLEQTNEMLTVRRNRYKCGYCGLQIDKPSFSHCPKCDPEKVESKYHDLLILRPIVQC